MDEKLVEQLAWRERVLEDGSRTEETIAKTRAALTDAATALTLAQARIRELEVEAEKMARDYNEVRARGDAVVLDSNDQFGHGLLLVAKKKPAGMAGWMGLAESRLAVRGSCAMAATRKAACDNRALRS